MKLRVIDALQLPEVALSTPNVHLPPCACLRSRIASDLARIVGCTCGWRTPPGTTDSDDAYAEHYAEHYARGTVSP